MAAIVTLEFDVTADTETPGVTIIRNSDGSIEFTDIQGNKVVAHSNEEISKLFGVLAGVD
jgi:hypothetical protein